MSDHVTSEFATFLEVVAGLFHFGCSFIPFRVPSRARNPILDPRQSWSLPDNIERRDLDTNSPLPSRLVEIMKRHKAPNHRRLVGTRNIDCGKNRDSKHFSCEGIYGVNRSRVMFHKELQRTKHGPETPCRAEDREAQASRSTYRLKPFKHLPESSRGRLPETYSLIGAISGLATARDRRIDRAAYPRRPPSGQEVCQ